MRIKLTQTCIGDERIVRKFLFLPKIIGYELRWLEFAKIKQICDENGWINYSFENDVDI